VIGGAANLIPATMKCKVKLNIINIHAILNIERVDLPPFLTSSEEQCQFALIVIGVRCRNRFRYARGKGEIWISKKRRMGLLIMTV